MHDGLLLHPILRVRDLPFRHAEGPRARSRPKTGLPHTDLRHGSFADHRSARRSELVRDRDGPRLGDRDDKGDPRPEIVADINIVKGSSADGSSWQQLDAIEVELETVASSVLNADPGDLRPDVEDLVHSAVGSQLLILNSVTVHEPWRGYGVGALLVGEAILALDGDAQCVATYPAPLDSSEGSDRTRAVAKLQRTWAQIGFKPPDECVWILDPGMEDLGDAVARLGSNFGLPAG